MGTRTDSPDNNRQQPPCPRPLPRPVDRLHMVLLHPDKPRAKPRANNPDQEATDHCDHTSAEQTASLIRKCDRIGIHCFFFAAGSSAGVRRLPRAQDDCRLFRGSDGNTLMIQPVAESQCHAHISPFN